MPPPPPIFDMRFAGTKDSALAAQIIPFLARVIGDGLPETVSVTICPREDFGLALKTVEKHVRRINDSAHEGLCQIYRFSVTDLSVPSAKPYKPCHLRIEASRRDVVETSPQGNLFEE